jgi:hypothetical protein
MNNVQNFDSYINIQSPETYNLFTYSCLPQTERWHDRDAILASMCQKGHSKTLGSSVRTADNRPEIRTWQLQNTNRWTTDSFNTHLIVKSSHLTNILLLA